MATGVGTYYFVGAGGGGGIFTNPYLGANGSVSAPTYSFTASPTTGMYSPAANQLAFAQNGVQALLFSGSQAATFSGVILGANGAVGTPAYSFASDPDTGMYWISANRLGLAVGGVNQLDIQNNILAVPGQINVQTYVQTGLSNVAGNAALILGGAATSMRFHKHATAASVYYTIDGNTTAPAAINTGALTVAKTSNYTIVLGDIGTHFTNGGASGAVQFTLPTPQAGFVFRFTCIAAQVVTVVTPSGSIFGPGSLSGTTRTITGTTAANQYSSFDVVCYDGSNWVVRGVSGTVT